MTPGAGGVYEWPILERVAREGTSSRNAAPQGIRQDSLLEKCPDLLKIRSLAGIQALFAQLPGVGVVPQPARIHSVSVSCVRRPDKGRGCCACCGGIQCAPIY